MFRDETWYYYPTIKVLRVDHNTHKVVRKSIYLRYWIGTNSIREKMNFSSDYDLWKR
jgi:hypothetical protein